MNSPASTIPSITEQIEAIEECIEVYRKSFTHAFGEHYGEIIDPKANSDIARLEAAVETLKRASARRVPFFLSFRVKSFKPDFIAILRCSLIAAAIGFSASFICDIAFWHAPAEISRAFGAYGGYHVVRSITNVFFSPASVLPTAHSTAFWWTRLIVAYTVAPLFWGLVLYLLLRLWRLVAVSQIARE